MTDKNDNVTSGVAGTMVPPPQVPPDPVLPAWAQGLRDTAGKFFTYMSGEPKHAALQVIHDELKRALAAWDAEIAKRPAE